MKKLLSFGLLALCFYSISLSRTASNLGFEVTLKGPVSGVFYERRKASSGFDEVVLSAEIENVIDPFLVFDYDVNETVYLLSIDHKVFLHSSTGFLYRLNPKNLGNEGHFAQNIGFKQSGDKQSGTFVFEIPSGESGDFELLLIDEQFAPLRIPLNEEGKLSPLEFKAEAEASNSKLSLRLASHGEWKHPEGIQPRAGHRFYSVELWGKSLWQKEVASFYIEPDVKKEDRTSIGFPFVYKRADSLLNLTVDGVFAYPYRKDLSSVLEEPTFTSEHWSKLIAVFEIPSEVDSLSLDAQFGKMGLVGESLSYLETISFELQKGNPASELIDAFSFLDTEGQQELEIQLSSIGYEDGEPSVDDVFLLWVEIENRGDEPGMFNPWNRFWIDDKTKLFPKTKATSSSCNPPDQLFLIPGQKRRYVLEWDRSVLPSIGSWVLNFSGIGNQYTIDLDPVSGQFALRDDPNEDKVAKDLIGEVVKVQQSPAPEQTASSSRSMKEKGSIVLHPYHVEEIQPHFDHYLSKVASFTEELKTLPFNTSPAFDYETFESVFGRIGFQESEENNTFETANPGAANQTISGVTEREGIDYWVLDVPRLKTGERYSLYSAVDTSIEGVSGAQFYLYNDQHQIVESHRIQGTGEFRHMLLDSGQYYVVVENLYDHPDTAYRFAIVTELPIGNVEEESNNEIEHALSIDFGETYNGHLNPSDQVDLFQLSFPEGSESDSYVVYVSTDREENGMELHLLDEAGNRVYHGSRTSFDAIPDLSPAAGDYFIEVRYSASSPMSIHYQLRVEKEGQRPRNREREPNDEIYSKSLSVISELHDDRAELYGQFTGYYGDFFILDVVDESAVYTISANGPEVNHIRYIDLRKGEIARAYANNGDPAVFLDMRLPLGLNYFYVEGKSGDYAVNIEKHEVQSDLLEWEPNNSELNAQLVTLGETYTGRIHDPRDEDFFRVVIRNPGRYELRMKADADTNYEIDFWTDGFEAPRLHTEEKGEVVEQLHLLPGEYFIQIEANKGSLNPYEIEISALSPWVENQESSFTITSLDEGHLEAAAYYEFHQLVHTQVQIENHSVHEEMLNLTGTSTHRGVNGVVDVELILEPGEKAELSYSWRIDPQSIADKQISLFLGAFTKDGIVAQQEVFLKLDPGALPTEHVHFVDPDFKQLAGGLNLNLLTFGAAPIIPDESDYPEGARLPEERHLKILMDGALNNRSFYGYQAISKLAGDGTIPVAGVSFDLHGRGNIWDAAKDFVIETSTDGENYREVFSGTLQSFTGDQWFAFTHPVNAQYAKLRILNNQGGTDAVPHLGEWRVIAEPSQSITDLERVDLLDKKRGGHLIHESSRSRVYGFHHNRIARLKSFAWEERGPSSTSRYNPEELTIETSMDSPIGPWTTIGSFDQIEGEFIEHVLPEDTWARFVKVSWSGDMENRKVNLPKHLHVYESPVRNEYRSILGEWGGPGNQAIYESLQTEKPAAVARFKRIKSSKNEPKQLPFDQSLSSAVWINEQWEDWYEIRMDGHEKRVEIKLTGDPFVKVDLEVFDSTGNPVKVRSSESSAKEKTFLFTGQKNEVYKAHVFEPKRSIIYLWDVSGSMGSFVGSIENAVLEFAKEVNPETEKVNLLPFDDPTQFLLDGWESNRYRLQNIIRSYDAPDSSYAHLNLLSAVEMLESEKGTKAAIVITDCESGRAVNKELWDALERVRPAVFTFQTSDHTKDYGIEQDDMQDWAAVAGGFYYNTREPSELDTAFERVQTYLRRPAPYHIQLSAPKLGPAKIAVVDGRKKEEVKDVSQDAILLIVDVSASMREKLPDGQMKASAAKKVIQELVDNYLPAGSNFGLRVFGHRGGANCESELKIPVGPLDKDNVRQQLLLTRTSSLGNTALAESLSKAPADFGELVGGKRIIVLTDGEETCKGDPAQVIAELATQGLEVTVNIVGFTLGDESVKFQYGNWVKSTGGLYYDAQDLTSLGVMLKEAMTPVELPNFKVFNTEGKLIHEGKVGDPAIELPSGTYKVIIQSKNGTIEEQIEAYESLKTVKWLG